ncbi:MAG: two-component sensor histidine kinase [Rhodobacterales bacterium]|nr:MAG: two-component sensor histidine kinase [Rhodobacterales bacterium]
MTNTTPSLFGRAQTGRCVRLRTLTTLRWAAALGQIGAIVIARQLFGFRIELGLAAGVIGASVVLNVMFHFVFPQNKRLTEREATLMLAFDTIQLGILLGVTGGLNNPFAMLIVAPVTVAATALSLGPTLVIDMAAVALVTLMPWICVPLITPAGEIFALPQVFALGHWVAIMVAIMFVGFYTRTVSAEILSMSQGLLATQMALAREQKLTDLGGVVAAAAHELGTPLATIKLVSSEMIGDLEEGTEMYEDALLIRDQADRCRDIMRSMGRAGKDDLHLRQALLTAVIEEAAEPHRDRGKEIVLQTRAGDQLPEESPMVLRRPELVHGLRNLIQNAVDFAATTVWVEACWTENVISVRIIDDGTGYPPHLLGRIGDPFLRKEPKATRDSERPEYEGMGLGLFIAKTLLERTGAELAFVNGASRWTGQPHPGEPLGAIVEVSWNRGAGAAGIEAEERTPALGKNVHFGA